MDDSQLVEPPPAPSPAEARRRSRARFNQGMKLVRRVHLYAGLFMTPWVFLYGVSAFLFNHPEVMPDVAPRAIAAADLSGTGLAGSPRPEALAARVVAALNAAALGLPGGPEYRLVRPEDAAFTRELQATAKGPGKQYTIRYDLAAGSGSIREVAERPTTPPAPFASRRGPDGLTPPLAGLKSELPAALGRLGIPGDDVAVRTAPELGFLMTDGGRTWRVQYDLASGAVSGREDGSAGDPLSARRFLLRLHTAHGYPSEANARWAWALSVDAMAASMVGWGATGLLMWWQMKNLRRIGLITLVASAAVATVAAVGMHAAMVAAPPANRAAERPEPGTRADARPGPERPRPGPADRP